MQWIFIWALFFLLWADYVACSHYTKYSCFDNSTQICNLVHKSVRKAPSKEWPMTRGVDSIQKHVPLNLFNFYKKICNSRRILEYGCGIGRTLMEVLSVNPGVKELLGVNMISHDRNLKLKLATKKDLSYFTELAAAYGVPVRCVPKHDSVALPGVKMVNETGVDAVIKPDHYDLIFSQNSLDHGKVLASDSHLALPLFLKQLKSFDGALFLGLIYSIRYTHAKLHDYQHLEKVLRSRYASNKAAIIPIKYTKLNLLRNSTGSKSVADVLIFAFDNAISLVAVKSQEGDGAECFGTETTCQLKKFMRTTAVVADVEGEVFGYHHLMRDEQLSAQDRVRRNVYAADYLSNLFAELNRLKRSPIIY